MQPAAHAIPILELRGCAHRGWARPNDLSSTLDPLLMPTTRFGHGGRGEQAPAALLAHGPAGHTPRRPQQACHHTCQATRGAPGQPPC